MSAIKPPSAPRHASGTVQDLLAKLAHKQAELAAAFPCHPASIPAYHATPQPSPPAAHPEATAALRLQLSSVLHQLQHAADEQSRSAAQVARHRERSAALEARAQQLEEEFATACAARRAAEQEAAAARAQAGALTKSLSARQADSDQAVDFYRAQLERKTEEVTQLEQALQKHATEVERIRTESSRRYDCLSASERRQRERCATLERQLLSTQEDTATTTRKATEELSSAHKKAAALEASVAALTRHQEESHAELTRVKEAAAAAEGEARAMRERLAAERVEWAAREERRSKRAAICESADGAKLTVQEAVRDVGAGAAQRASLLQECRSLRSQVAELEGAVMEAQTAKERLKHKAELKLAAAAHQHASLRSKLDAKAESLRVAQEQIAALRVEADTWAEKREETAVAERERAAAAKRALEEERRAAARALAQAEAQWQERAAAEASAAVASHQQRIQDLELQLTSTLTPAAGGDVALVSGGGSAGGGGAPGGRGDGKGRVAGGYAAAVLDYIPRAEHVRLLEVRSAAREAAARAQMAAALAQAEQEWRGRVDVVRAELSQVQAALQEASATLAAEQATAKGQRVAHDAAQAAAKQEIGMLQQCCNELRTQLDAAHAEIKKLKAQAVDAAAQIEAQQAQHESAQRTAAQEAKRLQQAAEEERARHENQCAEKEAAMRSAAQEVTRLQLEVQAQRTAHAVQHTQHEAALRTAARQQGQDDSLLLQRSQLSSNSTEVSLSSCTSASTERRCSELEAALASSRQRCQTLATRTAQLAAQAKELERENGEARRRAASAADTLVDARQRCQEAEAGREALQKRVETLEAEQRGAAEAAAAGAAQARAAAEVAATAQLDEIERCLGLGGQPEQVAQPVTGEAGWGAGFTQPVIFPSQATTDSQANPLPNAACNRSVLTSGSTGTHDARLAVLLSRCRQLQAESAARGLAAQHAQQEVARLQAAAAVAGQEAQGQAAAVMTRLAALQQQHAALQVQYDSIQRQYASDMGQLEAVACRQIHNVKAEAEQTITGLRRTSTLLHERLTGELSRADSLAAEVEGLRVGLAQQAKRAAEVEAKEAELARLMAQLTATLTVNEGAAAEVKVGTA